MTVLVLCYGVFCTPVSLLPPPPISTPREAAHPAVVMPLPVGAVMKQRI